MKRRNFTKIVQAFRALKVIKLKMKNDYRSKFSNLSKERRKKKEEA